MNHYQNGNIKINWECTYAQHGYPHPISLILLEVEIITPTYSRRTVWKRYNDYEGIPRTVYKPEIIYPVNDLEYIKKNKGKKWRLR